MLMVDVYACLEVGEAISILLMLEYNYLLPINRVYY
jgi:hypothetical protein